MDLFDIAVASKLAGGGGGGGGGVTPAYEDTVTAQTTSTSGVTIKSVTLENMANKGLLWVVTDNAGIRDGYFYSCSSTGFVSYNGWVPNYAVNVRGSGENAVAERYNSFVGVYLGAFSKTGNNLSFKIYAKYNSAAGNIDGTYKIQVFAFQTAREVGGII